MSIKERELANSNNDNSIEKSNTIEEQIESNGYPNTNSHLHHKENSNMNDNSNTQQSNYNKFKLIEHKLSDQNHNNGYDNDKEKSGDYLLKSKQIKQRDNNSNHIDEYNNYSHNHSQSHNESHRKQSSSKKLSEDNEPMRIISDNKTASPIEETNDIIFKKKINNNNNNNQYNRSKVLYHTSNNNHHNKFRQLNGKIILNDNTTINWNSKWNYAAHNNNNDPFQRNKKTLFPHGATTLGVGVGVGVSVENTKKRNNTAKTINKYNLGETNSTNMFRRTTARIGSTFKPGKKLELKQNKMLSEMNNPKNPYSTYWTNKILDKRYNMELCSSGFLNGIPIIKLNYKKNMFAKITKKQIKEDLIRMKKRNEEIEQETTDIEVKPEVEDKFNTNMKNFFKARKDIQEESVEKEEDDEEKKNDLIEFPKIYNFFQR